MQPAANAVAHARDAYNGRVALLLRLATAFISLTQQEREAGGRKHVLTSVLFYAMKPSYSPGRLYLAASLTRTWANSHLLQDRGAVVELLGFVDLPQEPGLTTSIVRAP